MLLYVHIDRTDYYGRGAQDGKPRTGSQEPRTGSPGAQEPRTGSSGAQDREPRTDSSGAQDGEPRSPGLAAQEPRASTRLIFHTVHS